MEPFLIEEASKISGARIVAVGVGGGGGNMIGHMIRNYHTNWRKTYKRSRCGNET